MVYGHRGMNIGYGIWYMGGLLSVGHRGGMEYGRGVWVYVECGIGSMGERENEKERESGSVSAFDRNAAREGGCTIANC